MSRNAQSRNIGDYHDEFVKAIEKATPQLNINKEDALADSILDVKQRNAFNGLETSTFTVCSRIRPVLAHDQPGSGENFKCIVPGAVTTKKAGDRCEPTLILTPKVSLMGKAQIEPTSLDFDHTFGPDVSHEEIFQKVGQPLVKRCMAGEVGVVFAYGQTGSGKTHTMSGIMDQLVHSIFAHQHGDEAGHAATAAPRSVSFSYVEILGQSITDCLVDAFTSGASAVAGGGGGGAIKAGSSGEVKVGEMLDGRVEIRNLTEVSCSTPADFMHFVDVAKARRATECTERNATSSRSHGVGIITIGPPAFIKSAAACDEGERPSQSSPQPAAGRLYIIDLAGSERMSDSKNHTDSRMEETKAINLSLMSLKECIRARTLAGLADGRSEVHVPYRRSKLTLLMKDVFDISCRRLCSTVVIAHVSPLARDVKHSVNTLQYAAPLRVSVRSKKPAAKYEVDERDPANWSHEQVDSWISATIASSAQVQEVCVQPLSRDAFSVDALLSPHEGGIALCMMPESEFYRRTQHALEAHFAYLGTGTNGKDRGVDVTVIAPQIADALYTNLWTLICDAKVRRRHPDGSLVSEAEEAAEKLEKEKMLAEKSALWAEREAHMKSDLVGYDGKPL